VRLANGQAEPALIGGDDNQVDVIGHQTVRPDLHASLPGLLGKEVAKDVLIAVLEENRLSAIAPLRHMRIRRMIRIP
jgi:hypothetical protein